MQAAVASFPGATAVDPRRAEELAVVTGVWRIEAAPVAPVELFSVVVECWLSRGCWWRDTGRRCGEFLALLFPAALGFELP